MASPLLPQLRPGPLITAPNTLLPVSPYIHQALLGTPTNPYIHQSFLTPSNGLLVTTPNTIKHDGPLINTGQSLRGQLLKTLMKNDPNDPYWYHGTTEGAAKEIEKTGKIEPRTKFGRMDNIPRVFLANTPELARKIGGPVVFRVKQSEIAYKGSKPDISRSQQVASHKPVRAERIPES